MAVKLSKGQKVNLRKDNPNLKRVLVGLGWDPVEQQEAVKHKAVEQTTFLSRLMDFFGVSDEIPSNEPYTEVPDIDVDASVICIGKKNSYVKLVFFRNLEYHHGAIKHYGDNLTGQGEEGADDEQIEIRLDEIPEKIKSLSMIINIYRAYERKQSFGEIKNCYVHVTDMTGIFVADLERSGNDWHFEAIGEGVKVENIAEMISKKCK